jgi:hypothetical protein
VKRSEVVCIGAIVSYYIAAPLIFGLMVAGAPRVYLDAIAWFSLIPMILICGFIGNRLLDDSSAREREAKRQIMLESPHVLMPDEEYRREEGEGS